MFRCPKHLTGEGKALWERHAKRLEEEGLLRPDNLDSFILTCDIWHQLRTIDPDEDSKIAMRYSALLKHWPLYAKQFKLFLTKAEVVSTATDAWGL